jgi:hypothetical protein
MLLTGLIRDALTLLMEEYPFAGDRSGPHRLAAHEFLSDRYESPLDTLLGETDSAALEEFLSDPHAAVVETLLSDPNEDDDILSDANKGEATAPSRPPRRRAPGAMRPP